MTPRDRVVGSVVAAVLAVALGVAAAWPIYQSWWLLVPAAAALVIGCGVAVLAAFRKWSLLTAAGVLAGLFALTVAPVAVPRSFAQLPWGPVNGLIDGVAATVLGWKQLLTLALPVGTYQTMLVPAYLVFVLTAFLATWIAARAGRFAPLAAFPLLAPVAFGTVFGSSAVSAPLRIGGVAISAPREIGLWAAAALLGVIWVAYTAGSARRAALRLGRTGSGSAVRGRAARPLIAAATVAAACLAGVALAPALDAARGGDRQVPRDRVDPELVIREQTSPLAAYRVFKRDDRIDVPLFTVTADGALPARLRIAVLDDYDGVDFHVGSGEAGRFSRFPSGERVTDPTRVSVRIAEGYDGIWVPTAGLGSAPSFSGERADELEDAFYVNRDTDAAIAVPGAGTSGAVGLTDGDAYAAVMSAAPDAELVGDAAGGTAFDADAVPELASWIEDQDLPANGAGLAELIQRLRDRGYLSHSISDADGSQAWLTRLSEQYGTRFESSAGGHSIARIEQMFAQLNSQARLAGESADSAALVAAVGDDEQFATAAALIARAVGFESRVVLGVRLGGEEAGVPGIPACADTCTGEHLSAWVEVRGAEGEWVPLDTTPQVSTPPVSLEEGEQLPEFATAPEERDAREVDPPLGLGEQNDAADEAETGPATGWIWPVLRAAGLSGAALLLLAVPLLFLPVAKRLRARRRRAQADPELRALGGWQEMVDRAVDAGVVVPAGASRMQIAEALGTAPARWAAEQVDRAVFSPSGISDADADWVWQAAEADRRERDTGISRRTRFLRAYALRSYGVSGRARRTDTEESAEASAEANGSAAGRATEH